MNTTELFEQLEELFQQFQFHPKCIKELRNLFQKDLSGKEKQFFKSLSTQLNYIKEFGTSIDQVGANEKLKGFNQDFYSIHIKGKQYNIRLLMAFDQNKIPAFLCIFNEKNGKRATDYSKYTEVIESRFVEIIGGKDNE